MRRVAIPCPLVDTWPRTGVTGRRGSSRAALRSRDSTVGGPGGSSRPHFGLLWISGVALCTALGLRSVAAAERVAAKRNDATYPFFWLGLLLLFVPLALGALRKATHRRERLLLVVLLGVALYLVKLLVFPDAFP